MPSLSKMMAASALVAAAAAAPAPNANQAQLAAGFTLTQTANPNFKANGLAQRLKALSKFKAHSQYHTLIEQTGTGSVSATPADAYDSEYLCPVKIGSSGAKTLQLDFDTGSADLWVFSNQLPSGQQSGHNVYNTASGKKVAGASWQISYGDGSSAGGSVYRDTVAIGAATVTNQAVEAARTASSEFISGPNDGLVGLAFSSINTVSPNPVKTWIDSAVAQGMKNVFASNLKYHEAGSYDFGKIDSSKYSGSLHYTDIDDSQGFWMFSPAGYQVNGQKQSGGELSGIADTGTTLILADPTMVKNYYKKVSGARYDSSQGGYTYPCSTKLPSFSLVLDNGYVATVPGQYMNYAPLTDGSTTCYGGIQPNTGLPFSIYGDVFLKSQYTVYDRTGGSPRIGFAATK